MCLIRCGGGWFWFGLVHWWQFFVKNTFVSAVIWGGLSHRYLNRSTWLPQSGSSQLVNQGPHPILSFCFGFVTFFCGTCKWSWCWCWGCVSQQKKLKAVMMRMMTDMIWDPKPNHVHCTSPVYFFLLNCHSKGFFSFYLELVCFSYCKLLCMQAYRWGWLILCLTRMNMRPPTKLVGKEYKVASTSVFSVDIALSCPDQCNENASLWLDFY